MEIELIDVLKEESGDLKQYVVENVEDPILQTFNTLWDERDYWKYPPCVAMYNGEIVGFCAYTINEKYPGFLKVYYLHVKVEYRRRGITKKFLKYIADIALSNNVGVLYITEENTDGSKLFKDKKYQTKENEFGTIDKVYEFSKEDLAEW